MIAAQTIVAIANGYANANIEEIQPNLGWTDKQYQTDMIGCNWYRGAEWCAAAAILDWKKSLSDDVWAVAKKLVSLNSQQMARNFHADPVWPTSTDVPRLGAIVVWQAGDSFTNGHTGIVVAIDGDQFTSVEGNTIPAGNPGNEREGYTVAAHVHTIGLPHSDYNLNLDRFIYALDNYDPLEIS